MTSCPAEEDLVLFVEGDLGEARTEEVAEHLVQCEDCRRLLGRSEAALRYALGGLADAESAAPVVARPRGRLLRVALAASAAAAAVVAAAVFVVRGADESRNVARVGTPADAPHTAIEAPPRPATIADQIALLQARAERLAATPSPADESSDVALAALAAAEARLDLGMDTGRARLADVVEEFPGTTAAREARARLAALGDDR
jgi:anti-sigma factor ChrR (cupin superfamily)